MKVVKRLALLLVLFLLIITSVASAQNPDNLLISSEKAGIELIANNHDNSTITVYIYEDITPVSGVQVNFSLMNPLLGVLSAATDITDESGKATVIFTAGTTPGIAEIRADASSLTGTVTQRVVAPIPDSTSTIVSNTEWLIANGSDRATITVYAYNSSPSYNNYPIPGLQVQFSVNNSVYGTFNPVTVITNSEGIAQSSFKTGTKSGTALLYGNVTYRIDNVPYIHSIGPIEQKIDHDYPYSFAANYPDYTSDIEVGTVTPIILQMVDRYGNVIENQRETDEGRTAELIQFSLSGSPSTSNDPPEYKAAFWNGTAFVPNIAFEVNESGIISVDFKADARPGTNYILISPQLATIADQIILITGIASGTPYGIEGWVIPASIEGKNPWVYAGEDPSDESRKFTFTYKIIDQYGNGLELTDVNVTILAGAERTDLLLTTNATGYTSFKYGPRPRAIYDLVVNATPSENQSVYQLFTVDFVSTDPIDILVTANPQTMASLDANPNAQAEIRAKVINAVGDGVGGEFVTFTLQNIDYGEDYIKIDPYLEQGSALTESEGDSIGYASVIFRPGWFKDTYPGYDPTATGTCDVVATWINPEGDPVVRSVKVAWKNYPYLNVYTYLDKETANLHDTVNVTIRVVGDGHRMTKKPIDVIICHDRSGSMLMDLPDRMVSAMDAAKQFVQGTTPNVDRNGLVSFGHSGTVNIQSYQTTADYLAFGPGKDRYWGWSWTYYKYMWLPDTSDDASYIAAHYPGNGRTYSAYATVDTSPSLNFDQANVVQAIRNLAPWSGTPMRSGLYKAIKEFDNYPDPGNERVRAVILLSDGDYNWYGDPLARGTGYTTAQKSVTSYNEGTQDYTTFSDIAYQNLSRLAIEKNVKIFTIAYANDITPWGNNTLRILSESSGGKHYVAPTGSDLTTIYNLIAGQLSEEAGVDTELDTDFETIQVDTEFFAGNEVLEYIGSEPTSTNISHYHAKTFTTDWEYQNHTAEWLSSMKILFNIDTMYKDDVWQAVMTFRVNKVGNIKIFNSTEDSLFFTTSEGRHGLPLPDTYLFAEFTEDPGQSSGTFEETDFSVSNPGGTTIFEWTWLREYTGQYAIEENYFVSVNGGQEWTQVGRRTIEPPIPVEGRFRFDIRDMIPSGGGPLDVVFKLTGRAIDAPSPRRVNEGWGDAANFSGVRILLE